MWFVVSKVSERDGLVDPASFELLCRWGSDPATDCSEKTMFFGTGIGVRTGFGRVVDGVD